MVSTNIKDLKYRYESEFLDDISPQEMTNIKGGYIPRRWRRDPRNIPVETSNTGIPSIDDRINYWQAELKQNYDLLQAEFGF
ncbi:MAG: hypothetical protein EAZ87_09600 [Nostocales cyanobacterium]|nr:MAG: hypothetical protein EAZ87_09600 [Nostocales cyanobacterium]